MQDIVMVYFITVNNHQINFYLSFLNDIIKSAIVEKP